MDPQCLPIFTRMSVYLLKLEKINAIQIFFKLFPAEGLFLKTVHFKEKSFSFKNFDQWNCQSTGILLDLSMR